MNWKEQFERNFQHPLQLIPTEPRLAVLHDMETYISKEIIEKLIADIPDGIFVGKGIPFKKQLRDKWL